MNRRSFSIPLVLAVLLGAPGVAGAHHGGVTLAIFF